MWNSQGFPFDGLPASFALQSTACCSICDVSCTLLRGGSNWSLALGLKHSVTSNTGTRGVSAILPSAAATGATAGGPRNYINCEEATATGLIQAAGHGSQGEESTVHLQVVVLT